MAYAHHDTSRGYQGSGRETKFLSSKQAGNGYIPPGFKLSVTFQDYPVPQVIPYQGLLGFCDPEFPGEAGVLERSQGGGAGAAVFALLFWQGEDVSPWLVAALVTGGILLVAAVDATVSTSPGRWTIVKGDHEQSAQGRQYSR